MSYESTTAAQKKALCTVVSGTHAELVSRPRSNPTASRFVSSVGHSSGVNLDQDPKTAAIGVPSDGIELIPRSNPTASRFVSSVGHSSGVDQDPKTADTGVSSDGIELLRKIQFKDSTNCTLNISFKL